MSFLHPWLWLGAAGVVVPLWLHLRAKTGSIVAFSAVRFLEDQPRPRLTGLRLRDALLFLARLAAVLLLVAGFAWPYRKDATARIVTESRVHILDNTLSQQVRGGFRRDLDELRDTLRRSGPEVQDAVVELTARPRVLVAFGEDRAEAERKLGSLQPSFQRGSYLEAFRLAQSLLARGLGATKRIVVHGDGQENQWTESENSPPFLDGVQVDVESGENPAQRPNVAVSDPAARLLFVGDRTFVDFQARLSHGRLERPATVTVVLEAGGRQVVRQPMELRPEPESLTVMGQWRTDPEAWLQGEMHLEGLPDDLPADDRVYFCLPPVKEGRIALLSRSPYLRAALAPEIMRGRWATHALDPTSSLDVAEKDLADVLVLDGDYAQSGKVRDLALRYLNNQRGVVLLLGRTTPLLDGFLRTLGFEPARTRSAGSDRPEAFRFVAAQHPIFKPFLGGELGDLLDVRVLRHVRLHAREATPLVHGDSGDGVLFEGTSTRGRLLVFAFAFERAQTDWPLQPSFIPFLDLCLQHTRAAAPLETSALPGDLHVHEVPAERAVREVVLRGRDQEMARVAVGEGRQARLPVPDRPGFYSITYDADPTVVGMFAVNPSPKESDLRYTANPAAVKAWSVPPRETASAAGSSPAEAGGTLGIEATSRALDQRLWWWLLLAGSLALATEGGLLFFRRGRA